MYAELLVTSQCLDISNGMANIASIAEHMFATSAEQKVVMTPIKVAIPTELNRKTFSDSAGGLISPGDNSTVYEPER